MRYALFAVVLSTLAAAGCRHHHCGYKRTVVEYVPASPQLPPAYYTPSPPACR